MEKVYLDSTYEVPELTEMFEKKERKINKDAAALVVICSNKLYQLMHDYAFQIIRNEVPLNAKSIKKLFIHVSSDVTDS